MNMTRLSLALTASLAASPIFVRAAAATSPDKLDEITLGWKDALGAQHALEALSKDDQKQLIPLIRRRLTSRDPRLGHNGVEAAFVLGLAAEELALEMRVGLRSANESSRVDTVRFFEKLGPKAALALPELTAALKDRSPEVRGRAADALAAVGADAAPALPALRAAARDSAGGDAPARALRATVRIRGTSELDPFYDELLKSPKPELRRLAARTLSHLAIVENLRATPFVQALKDSDREVRFPTQPSAMVRTSRSSH